MSTCTYKNVTLARRTLERADKSSRLDSGWALASPQTRVGRPKALFRRTIIVARALSVALGNLRAACSRWPARWPQASSRHLNALEVSSCLLPDEESGRERLIELGEREREKQPEPILSSAGISRSHLAIWSRAKTEWAG